MSKGSIKQGEIWIVNFEPQIGTEINKTRPAVIIGRNDCVNFNIKIVVPITIWKDKFCQGFWFVKIQHFVEINNILYIPTRNVLIEAFCSVKH
ncbi:type II toxin-antitoxin system PemK/MazF family toxin [Helicobacter labetoulli]|uniref:type II toxin-antitoxin system PemK/MazF family toxin n=1 Tax=Helicobacter labetoulli TaxID=2315333 RepID=UPI000EF6E7D4